MRGERSFARAWGAAANNGPADRVTKRGQDEPERRRRCGLERPELRAPSCRPAARRRARPAGRPDDPGDRPRGVDAEAGQNARVSRHVDRREDVLEEQVQRLGDRLHQAQPRGGRRGRVTPTSPPRSRAPRPSRRRTGGRARAAGRTSSHPCSASGTLPEERRRGGQGDDAGAHVVAEPGQRELVCPRPAPIAAAPRARARSGRRGQRDRCGEPISASTRQRPHPVPGRRERLVVRSRSGRGAHPWGLRLIRSRERGMRKGGGGGGGGEYRESLEGGGRSGGSRPPPGWRARRERMWPAPVRRLGHDQPGSRLAA